jgi:hypothetical protein
MFIYLGPNVYHSSIAVFSSIENRNDILSEKNAKLEMNSKANNRPNIETTKRYSISSGIKDNFYAIHHIPRSCPINENEPLQTVMDIKSENMEPVRTKPKKSSSLTTPNRGRKRISPEQVSLSTPSFPSATAVDQPISPLNNQSDTIVPKRKKSRHGNTKTRNNSKDQPAPSLNQTCCQLWPDANNTSMGDLSYENIKSLSNLLKVRLSQAKFRMMAKLDQDNELFTFLSEEYVPPKPRKPFAMTGKQSKSTMAVVGNSKNLFARNNKTPKRYSAAYHDVTSLDVPSTPIDTTSPQHPNQKTPNSRKKKSSKTTAMKPKRVTTPKRRSAAADVIPVTLSDGSCVYVCEPCNKKYKNRNGLAYHMERCKNTKKPTQDNQHTGKEANQSQESIINCICSQKNDEAMTMVQCDKCRTWLHSECVGLSEDALEDSYYCARCKVDESSDSNCVGKDLLQCLLEAQASDRLEQQQKQQASQSTSSPNSQFQELFSQTTPQNEDNNSTQLSQLQEFLSRTPMNENNSEEDDELLSIPQSGGFFEEDLLSEMDAGTQLDPTDYSSQLHIWDDFNTTSFDKEQQQPQQWTLLDDEEPFSNYDTDSWTLNDMNLFSQPPSLLFSDATVNSSTLEDDNAMPTISTPVPISESTPLCELTPKHHCDTPVGISSSSAATTPVQTADGLWFQFANFDDDYQCETKDT